MSAWQEAAAFLREEWWRLTAILLASAVFTLALGALGDNGGCSLRISSTPDTTTTVAGAR